MIDYFFNWKKSDPEQLFQVLEGGIVSGKILTSFSFTQQTVVTLLQNILAQFYSGQKYYGS